MSSFDCKARIHANQQIEFKLHYPVNSKNKSRYNFNVYFFVPKQLNVTSRTFPIKYFFRKLKTYLRYEIAGIPIEMLVDRKCSVSPFSRIIRTFEEVEDFNFLDKDYIDYELKTFFNIANARLRERARPLRHFFRKKLVPPSGLPVELKHLIEKTFEDFEVLQQGLSVLEPFFNLQGVPSVLTKSFQWVQEGLSLRFEKNLWLLYRIGKLVNDPKLCQRCSNYAARELDFRKDKGFEAFVNGEDPYQCESFIFREHSIKKWAERIMYMRLKMTKNADRIGEALFGLAAVGAMGVSLALLFVNQKLFPRDSIYWIVFALIIYMFKDRIKEGLRRFFARIIPKLVSDREQYIFDQKTGKKCGKVRDWVFFVKEPNLPERVRSLRYRNKNQLDKLLVRENILSYQHQITVNGKYLIPEHTRLAALTEITRFDMKSWLTGMDKSHESVFEFKEDSLNRIKTQRVYHITAIVELVDHHDKSVTPAQLVRYRITANKSGLLRISEVNSD